MTRNPNNIPKERITLHRFGQLSTNLVAANQCKEVGHTHYNYEVTIICKNKLDENGFLIDNREINKVMLGLQQMASCEQLCAHFADELERVFDSQGTPVCELKVELKPITPGAPYKDFAEFILSRNYEHTEP